MMRRLLLVGLFAHLVSLCATGCCVDACGTRHTAMGRPMHFAGGDGCADGMCGGRRAGLFPFLKYRATCGAGCGEMYLDEWLSDPPDCCDPCDQCSHFVGPRSCGGCGRCDMPLNRRGMAWGGGCGGACGDPGCGGCGGMFSGRWWNLWGHRYSPGGSYGGYGYDEGWMDEGEVIYDGAIIEGSAVPSASPSQTPTPAARQNPSALKKAGGRPPYYEQGPEQPVTTSRSAPGYRAAPGYRTPPGYQPAPAYREATRGVPMSPKARYVR